MLAFIAIIACIAVLMAAHIAADGSPHYLGMDD